MSKAQYELLNAVDANAENPDTFKIPSLRKRMSVPMGHYVKLCFMLPEVIEGYASERMWVKVNKKKGRGYIGTLDNKPYYLEGVALGDTIEFGAKHILQISKTGGGEGPPAVLYQMVVVSRVLLEDEDARPGAMYRVEPAFVGDSGWQVLTGTESNEYLRDMGNLTGVQAFELVERFPELAEHFVAPVGTGFERNAETGVWEAVELDDEEDEEEPEELSE